MDGVKRISVDTQVKTIRKNGKSYTVPLGTVKNATTVKEATNYAIGIGGYSYDDDKLLSTVKDDYAMKTGTGITDAEITTVDIDLRELKSESLTLSGRGIDSVVLYGLLPYGILNGSA